MLLFVLAACSTSAPSAAAPVAECAPAAGEEASCNPEGPPAIAPLNVMGSPLAVCSTQPLTGWFRDGTCRTDRSDRGLHTVCAMLTDEFLAYTKGQGNDLSTARGSFPGLQAGDRWCLCAARWEEARRDGHAPPVILEATDDAALKVVRSADLVEHGVRHD